MGSSGEHSQQHQDESSVSTLLCPCGASYDGADALHRLHLCNRCNLCRWSLNSLPDGSTSDRYCGIGCPCQGQGSPCWLFADKKQRQEVCREWHHRQPRGSGGVREGALLQEVLLLRGHRAGEDHGSTACAVGRLQRCHKSQGRQVL